MFVFIIIFHDLLKRKYYTKLQYKHQIATMRDFGKMWGRIYEFLNHCHTFPKHYKYTKIISQAIKIPHVFKAPHSLFKSQQCHKHHLQSPERKNDSLVCDYAMIKIQALQAYLFIGNLGKLAEDQVGMMSHLSFCLR